jgi:acetyltransferase-like isoleucine patch superfamily enzyme
VEMHRLKAPKMVWGYQDASGIWRESTRVSDTVFFNQPENIYVEDNVFVGHYCILDGTDRLEIGEGCQLAAWNGIYTHSSHIAIRLYGAHYQEVPQEDKIGFKVAPVRLGKYVFIGAGAKVLPGVTIGDGALIAAGCIVSRDVEAYAIVSGNPAKVVGDTRKLDKRYLDDAQLLEWYREWQE